MSTTVRFILAAAASVVLLAGCHKGGASDSAIVTAEHPEAAATLGDLTRDLHRSMIGASHLPTNFEEFAAEQKLTVPPPPAGTKYIISKKWHVELAKQ